MLYVKVLQKQSGVTIGFDLATKLSPEPIWVSCFQLSLFYLIHFRSHCVSCKETYFSVHLMF